MSVTRVKYHPPDKEERMERGRKIDLLLDETMRREREKKEAEKRRQQKDEEEERQRGYLKTFAYDCRMQFLERALLASCKKSHTTVIIQHCLYLRLS